MIKTILFFVVIVAMLVTIVAMAFGISYDDETEKSYKRADVCVYVVVAGIFVMFVAFMTLLHVTELNVNN